MSDVVNNIAVSKKTINDAIAFFSGNNQIDFDMLDRQFRAYDNLGYKFKMENSSSLINGFKEVLRIIDTYTDQKLFVNSFCYVMTFLLKATANRNVYLHLLDYILKEDSLTKENKFYLYNKLMREAFLNPEYEDEKSDVLKDMLYKQIVEGFQEELKEELQFINKEDRNKDFIIVLISQVLDMSHGPTKTLVDRCYILEKVLNKKVFIVNTAELHTPYGEVVTYAPTIGMYDDEYCKTGKINYCDRSFELFQCPREMPQTSIIREILSVVKTEKPYFVFTIGGNSIVSELCSKIVPTLSLATVFSERTVTYGTFQAIGRNINDSDRLWMKRNNLPKDHMIESLFTFTFREQTHKYTRRDLGLPEEGFIAVLVGGRLDSEIDDECERMILRLTDYGIKIVILGKFERFNQLRDKHKSFEKNGFYLGFQDDVLAIDECCDLYINPRRLGGGTSVAEALYKGLPAVTFDFGDVGVTAGKDFHVVDYEDMYNMIIKYSQDNDFYNLMSKKARQRGLRLVDSEGEFIKIIETMEKSPRF